MNNKNIYVKEFREINSRINNLKQMRALLNWDMMTTLPHKGQKERAKVISQINSEIYMTLLSDNTKKIINEMEQMDLFNIDDALGFELEGIKIDYNKIKDIPIQLYVEYTKLIAETIGVWVEAKEKNECKDFIKSVEKIFNYNIEFAELRGYTKDKYALLLSDYEKDLDAKETYNIVEEVKKGISQIIPNVHEDFLEINNERYNYDINEQKLFCKELIKFLNIDSEKIVFGESVHPFTERINENDVRFTTHYYSDDISPAVFATLHEAGHCMYELNIMDKLTGAKSFVDSKMALHESQSRLIENMIGRSKSFWEYLYPAFADRFKCKIEREELINRFNQVKPSLIRIEADELTYSLHIVIRTEIEEAIINGKMKVQDIPEVWNQKYYDYLKLKPKNYSEGFLQDIHWSQGYIGYFPCYLLGNVYSAQIYQSLGEKINVSQSLKEGKFSSISEWLRVNIHSFGGTKSIKAIMQDISKSELSSHFFIKYLESKFVKREF